MAWLHRSGGMMAGFQYACMAKYNPMTVPAMKTKNAIRTRLTKSMIARERGRPARIADRMSAFPGTRPLVPDSTARDIPPVEKLRECLTEGETRCASQLSHSS